ncbi:MAG: HoxN/HupN/NixA family nickel/cobalt transporter [Aliidongia sp.]
MFFRFFDDRQGNLPVRIAGLFALLIAFNLGAWGWALAVFRDHPILLGTAFLAYGLGLRHAVDADHIAAIDNVTRKLMQDGKRPVGVGFYFSLGHSTIVVLGSVALAATATAFKDRFADLESVGGVIGTLVSALFLLAIAAMNLVILVEVYRNFRAVAAGVPYQEADFAALLAGRGLLSRLFRPMSGSSGAAGTCIRWACCSGSASTRRPRSGCSASPPRRHRRGVPIWSILVFPALFTAGMALIDSADSVLMLRAYGWAFVRPIRKLYYNMTITFVSAVVALLVGGIEALGWRGISSG